MTGRNEFRPTRNNLLLPAALTVTASFTPIFARITVEEISPLSLGFLRFGFASLLFLITVLATRTRLRFENKDYIKLILLGALGIPVNQFCFLKGISMSYASHSGVIFSLNPIFAYIAAVAQGHEKFYRSKILAILLTVIGIFFVFYEAVTKEVGGNLAAGDLLLVLAVMSFSLYIAFGKKFTDKYGALKVTAFVFIAGSILDIPVFLIDMKNLNLTKVTASGITGFLYLSVIMSYAAYFLWYYTLKKIKISMLTTITNLAPILTVLASVVLLNEEISVLFVLGACITVIGVLVMQRVSMELT